MKKRIGKLISIYVLNILLLFLVTRVVHVVHNQFYVLLIIFFVVANFEVWFLNFWQNKETSELAIMKQRMVATSVGEIPRGVIAEPTSPYYELLEKFNNLQNYIRHMQYDTNREINNYQTLLTSLPVGVINVNRHHIIDVFNQTAADLLGVEMPKVPILDSLVIRHFTLSELINHTFNTEKKQQSILNLIVNGETKQYDVSTLFHQSGINTEVMVMLYDLTEVLKIERMQADFLANASHEFKTPLTAITGFVETLQGEAGADEDVRAQFLQIVANEANRLSALVSDILSLSRVQHKVDEKATNIKITQIIDQQLKKIDTKSVLVHNDVALNFNASGVTSDISTIVQNLLTNAIKYNRIAGEVWITASKNKQNWQINVRDSGIGIPLNQQSRIFERFYRGDESRQRRIASGTGLGLAIVNEIVNKHNGEIKVKSQVGVGTTISVILPL
ncbi:two-component sensor histidine kinase [Leuconostoc litchii]|uniref:histidine kinase n=1 Tax=Leuconostoc litchii TaxID=1981069 RepID=A0A6P2CR52_9LACO|nr:ATP-binding protein [Leuconostoc litchii]TYC47341.1 GHKL domain-containing protein [Leuconostoc litchii]GMA69342.1 two-component sensor histidine kinase [Leuconostoc litchii]